MTLALLAVAAGVLSFASPCCLPLVPGYLSYVSAIPVPWSPFGGSTTAAGWASTLRIYVILDNLSAH